MAQHTFCGRCGSFLSHPAAACPKCAPGSPRAVAAGQHNPYLAAALCVIPGLGHIYLGHKAKGLVTLAGFVGLQFFGADLDLTVVGAAVGVPMEMGGLGLWAWSVWDAYRLGRDEQARISPGWAAGSRPAS